MSSACSGFGLCGIPQQLFGAAQASAIRDITFTSNDGGSDDFGPGPILATRLCCKLIASCIGRNPQLARHFVRREIEIDLTPQGTRAEFMRAGCAVSASSKTKTIDFGVSCPRILARPTLRWIIRSSRAARLGSARDCLAIVSGERLATAPFKAMALAAASGRDAGQGICRAARQDPSLCAQYLYNQP